MGRSARLEPTSTSEDDHLAFAAKMKEKVSEIPLVLLYLSLTPERACRRGIDRAKPRTGKGWLP